MDLKLEGVEGKDYAHRMTTVVKMFPDKNKILLLGERNDSLLTKTLREARKNVLTVDLDGADVNMDLENGISMDEKYEIIFSGEVIEHIRNLKNLLSNIIEHMTEDGVFIFTTPNLLALPERFKALFGKLPINAALGDYFELHGHVRDWTWDLAEKYMKNAGFEILEEKTDGITIGGKMILRHTRKEMGTSIIMRCGKHRTVGRG